MKSKLILLLLSSLLCATSVVPPAPDGTRFFSESTLSSNPETGVQSSVEQNTSLISDDTLPRNDINNGLNYKKNFGAESNGTNYIDNAGRSNFMRTDGTTDQNMSSQVINDTTYQTWKQRYETYFKDTNNTTKRTNENTVKRDAMTETYRQGNTVNDLTSRFFKDKNLASGAQATTQSFRTNINSENAPVLLKETEDNATRMYNDLYSQTVNKSDKDYILKQNYGAVTKAFQNIEVIKEELTNRLTGATIKCQISRELIPSYKCPMPGKDGIMYPGNPNMGDIRKLNILEAKNECNNDCWSEPCTLTCVNKNILSSDNVNHSFPSNGITLFPNWNESTAIFEIPTDTRMPVKDINFTVTLAKPTGSNMTDTEWQNYLERTKFKFQYSILETFPANTSMPNATIADRVNVVIRSSEMQINVPINRLVNGLKIKFWKPFISASLFEDYRYQHFFDTLQSQSGSIKISGFNAKYSSDSHYFCQSLQMVSSPTQCVGGTTEQFTTGDDQFNYLCNADSKKIGPEFNWGAFYDQESCEYRCVVHKECVPTYRHYDSYGDETFMFRAKVSCVDEPGNVNCSQAVCEAHFADTEQRPLSEMVVANDDTFIYTIKNKVLQDHPRPKIDLSRELGTSVDYEQTFQNEEKDAAYLSMLDKMSFNRISYRIGTHSPFNMAYIREEGYGKNAYSIDLKPDSFQYDDTKNYYVYAIMKVFHSYTPVAGTWHLNGSSITATQTNIQFGDYSYAIKNSENSGDWKVFRREQFSKYLVDYTQYVLGDDGTFSTERVIDWTNTGQYKISNFELFNYSDNSWSSFSPSQQATFFKRQEFSSARDYYRFLMSDWVERDLEETPGLLVKSQIPINHETSFEKLFNVTSEHYKKSNIKNYTFYLVYSETPLSYDNLMKEIEGDSYTNTKIDPDLNKWGAFDYLTKNKFRSAKVKYDGEINNNINTLIMGNPANTSVSVDWTPAISEKGKKVFKFLFLYDDNESNPFEYANDNGEEPGQIQN